MVFSDRDLQDLRRLVKSTAPPVRVAWFVKAYPPGTSRSSGRGMTVLPEEPVK